MLAGWLRYSVQAIVLSLVLVGATGARLETIRGPNPSPEGALGTAIMDSSQVGTLEPGSGRQCDPSGGQWQEVPSPTDKNLYSVSMVSAEEGWAVGSGGTILHYNNGIWQAVASPTGSWLESVAMVSSVEGWAVGWGGILHYSDGGWKAVASPTETALLNSVSMVSAEEGWAVGGNCDPLRDDCDHTIMHYIGGEWQEFQSGWGALYSVDMLSANQGWAVGRSSWYGASATILHYLDGVWSRVGGSHGWYLNSVDMVSADEGWAVGYNGQILHYFDGTWQNVESPTGGELNSVSMLSADEGWAVGRGVILHYCGGEWMRAANLTEQWLRSVDMVSSDDGWAVGDSGVILRYSPSRTIENVTMSGPLLGTVGYAHAFTAAVQPSDTTVPITYTWNVDDQPLLVATNGLSNTATYTWTEPGVKALTVTAANANGSVTATYTVTLVTGALFHVTPDFQSSLVFTTGAGMTITIPVGGVAEPVTLVVHRPVGSIGFAPSGFQFAGQSFDLTAYDQGVLVPGYAFQTPVTVTIGYTDEDVAGMDEAGLILAYYDGREWVDASSTCAPPSAYQRQPAANRLSVAICHLSRFALFAPADRPSIYLPAVTR